MTNEIFEREMCEYKYDNDDENICVNVKLKIAKMPNTVFMTNFKTLKNGGRRFFIMRYVISRK